MATENFEIFNQSGTWTIIGVIIGFLLVEISAKIKQCEEQKEYKKALIEEVKFNHEQTKDKISTLDQSIAAQQFSVKIFHDK